MCATLGADMLAPPAVTARRRSMVMTEQSETEDEMSIKKRKSVTAEHIVAETTVSLRCSIDMKRHPFLHGW
eukprot:1724094-Rhodomonas_salina.1